MSVRILCCVPFCKRTRGQRAGEAPIRDGEEWICGQHWPAVPRRLRRLHAALRRRTSRLRLICESTDARAVAYSSANEGRVPQALVDEHADAWFKLCRKSRQWARVWERCKRAAIERAFGL